ncbi:hypothetical protein BDR05DRAFT_965745 [Suillus weaverae]|nr:hypothetical protein BDR05DRAFT_965745 [Suillus weaverae]
MSNAAPVHSSALVATLKCQWSQPEGRGSGRRIRRERERLIDSRLRLQNNPGAF